MERTFEDKGSDIEYLDQGLEPNEGEQGFDEVFEQADQVFTTYWECLYESLMREFEHHFDHLWRNNLT